MTMRAALRTSSNRAAVRLLEEIGIPSAADYAERLGVGAVPTVPSLALGSGEVTLESMTAAFGAFANHGWLFSPALIRRVETIDGHVLYQAAQQPKRVVGENTAFIMTSMMADVIDSGTASQARKLGFELPAAGKTGTTNDYHDAWFIGYTPNLVTGVWIGYDQPRTIIARGYAAILAVPLWARFMKAATAGDAPEEFPVPPTLSGVDICRVSGLRAGDRCYDVVSVASDGTVTHQSMVYTEYFIRGTEPVEVCRGHEDSSFDSLLIGTSGIGALPAEHTLPDLPPDETIPLPPPPDAAAPPDLPVQAIPPAAVPEPPVEPAPPVEPPPPPPEAPPRPPL
jgi:penicillin-binding protein 1A